VPYARATINCIRHHWFGVAVSIAGILYRVKIRAWLGRTASMTAVWMEQLS
jgi:hypothetical protein